MGDTGTVSDSPLKLSIQLENNCILRHFSHTECSKSEEIGDEVLIKRKWTSQRACLSSAYGI